jgi:uncharacterized damage-inducible protein DinB
MRDAAGPSSLLFIPDRLLNELGGSMLARMLTHAFVAASLTSLVFTTPALAQDAPKPAPPPISASGGLKSLQEMVKGFVIRAAEAMPEEHYAFKPTPDVRSFGEIVAHVANTQYNFCTPVRKVANPNKGNLEKTATTKAQIVAAVKEAFAFCDPAYEITDAGLNEMVKWGQRDIAASYTLTFNVAHNNEHYGNLVTYMRLKGLTPPSSEKR